MEISRAELGPLGTNAYFLMDSEKKEVWIVDPGGNGKDVVRFLEKEELQLKGILLTHGHSDHIGGVQDLIEAFPVPIYIHEKDEPMLTSSRLNLSASWGMDITVKGEIRLVKEGDLVPCGTANLQVIETPGHTPGGVCFFEPGEALERPTLFVGDTLFQGSIGRTDFPGGSMDELLDNIERKLYQLPDETIVFPGHGPGTTIGIEKTSNPFTRR